MTVQQFWKGLAMLLVSLALTTFNQVPMDWALFFVGGISSLFGYVGKNIVFIINTTSAWAKIVSGLLVAVGSGISESLGMIAVSGHVIWPVFFKVVGGILLTYIVTTFLAPPSAQSKQIKRFTLIKQAA
jgi:hypothetical protein